MNPGNTLNFGFQYPEFCVRFCLFIFSSSTIYIYVSSRISGFGMDPSMAKNKLFLSPTEVVLLCHWIITSNTVLFIQ
jgi:hypothetical protein